MWRSWFADLSRADVVAQLVAAETPGEVDAAAHVALLVHGVAACLVPFTERGREWPPVVDVVAAARDRVGGWPPAVAARAELLSERLGAARAARTAQSREAWAEREATIERLGIEIAVPRRPRPVRGTRGRGHGSAPP